MTELGLSGVWSLIENVMAHGAPKPVASTPNNRPEYLAYLREYATYHDRLAGLWKELAELSRQPWTVCAADYTSRYHRIQATDWQSSAAMFKNQHNLT